jgi:hypothetical protein
VYATLARDSRPAMWKVSSARSYQLAALLVLASAGFGAGWTLSTPGREPTRVCSETCGGLPVTGALATAAQGPGNDAARSDRLGTITRHMLRTGATGAASVLLSASRLRCAGESLSAERQRALPRRLRRPRHAGTGFLSLFPQANSPVDPVTVYLASVR